MLALAFIAMGDVFDAETGEKLELLMQPPAAIGIPTSTAKQVIHQQTRPEQVSPTRAAHRDTQSERLLGEDVGWERQQVAKVEKAEKIFRDSLAGIRHELQRHGLSELERLRLTTELLEKTKQNYTRHLQSLVVEEMAREMDREVAMRLEIAPLGRERMQRRHDKERAFYRAQITRVRDECEMALTAAAAKNNLLR